MAKERQKKTLLVLMVEGDTEVDFYKKLIAHLRGKRGGILPCEIKIYNMKGIGQYQFIAQRTFAKSVKRDYPADQYFYKVFLCYDTDVFEYAKKPPVDWHKVIAVLKKEGADELYQIEAKSSIEDWFLYDVEGIRNYLKLPKTFKMSGYKGQEGLKQLFRKANKTYIKGIRCADLVENLDMNKIFPKICDQIHVICEAVGMACKDENCGDE